MSCDVVVVSTPEVDPAQYLDPRPLMVTVALLMLAHGSTPLDPASFIARKRKRTPGVKMSTKPVRKQSTHRAKTAAKTRHVAARAKQVRPSTTRKTSRSTTTRRRVA